MNLLIVALSALLLLNSCTTCKYIRNINPSESPEANETLYDGMAARSKDLHEEKLHQSKLTIKHDPAFYEGHRNAGIVPMSLGRDRSHPPDAFFGRINFKKPLSQNIIWFRCIV